jgi:hypothetical protein
VPEGAAERHLVADEVEPRRPRMLLGPVNERCATVVQQAEMTDESLEGRAVTGRSDDGVDLEAAAAGEDGSGAVESFERGDDADAPVPDRIDETDVENRNHPTAQELRVRPSRCRQAVCGQVGIETRRIVLAIRSTAGTGSHDVAMPKT